MSYRLLALAAALVAAACAPAGVLASKPLVGYDGAGLGSATTVKATATPVQKATPTPTPVPAPSPSPTVAAATGVTAAGAAVTGAGNTFGVDPSISDADVKKIVDEEVAKAKAAYKGAAGYSMNDWGLVTGESQDGSIKHESGIDGYSTYVHYWVKTNSAVQARLKALLVERKKLAEAEAQGQADPLAAQSAVRPGQTAVATPTPASTPTPTPAPASAALPGATPTPVPMATPLSLPSGPAASAPPGWTLPALPPPPEVPAFDGLTGR